MFSALMLQPLMRVVSARVRGTGVWTPSEQLVLLRSLRKGNKAREALIIVNEGTEIPQYGIEFDVEPTFPGQMTKSLPQAVRRMNIKVWTSPEGWRGTSMQACRGL